MPTDNYELMRKEMAEKEPTELDKLCAKLDEELDDLDKTIDDSINLYKPPKPIVFLIREMQKIIKHLSKLGV